MANFVGAAHRTLPRFSTALPKISAPSRAGFRVSASLPAFPFTGLHRRKLVASFLRHPVELSSTQSLMPFHSATASALLITKLSLKPGSWAWLSEGFATPL